MDHMMPDMNGMEVTVRIRAMEGEYYKNLPIIALTANAVIGTREMFLENGFNDFLSKPIDTGKLNAILKKWIPREKRQKPAKQEIVSANETPPRPKISIKGIDTEKGLALTGGKLENYLNILSVFCNDGLSKIKEIQISLDKKNWGLFTTYIHALKSASAGIGADDISSAANSLEMAGVFTDTTYIYEHTGVFLADLEAMIKNIKEKLSEIRGVPNEIKIDTSAIKNDLEKLKTAFEEYDAQIINEITKKLSEFAHAPSIGGEINLILQYKITGEYDEAILLIDKILAY